MTERPGRGPRRVSYQTMRVGYLVSRSIDQLLFLVVVTLFAIITVGHILTTALMVTWLATLLPLAMAQLLLARNFGAGKLDQNSMTGRAAVLLACLMISGLTWGLIGLYAVTYGGVAEQVLIVALISSLVIYAVTHVSAVFGAFVIYVSVLSGPSIVVLVISPVGLTQTLGAALTVLVAAGMVGGWRHYQLLSRAVRLEVETHELHGVLGKLTLRLEDAEESAG